MTDTDVCVGAVVRNNKSVLLVRQSIGHALAGQWTIPWGRIESGESPSTAVLREITEESSISAEIVGLLGVQEMPKPWAGMIGILFLCTHVSGEPMPDSRETDAAKYFDREEINALGDSLESLSGWLVRRVFEDDFSLLRLKESNPFAPSISYG